MFVKTVKVKKPHPILLFTVLIIAAIALGFAVFGGNGEKQANTTVVDTELKRVEFLEKLGWEVSKEYTECKIVTIPSSFNDVYEAYNKMQKEQGFNLSKYKGKTVEIYSYEVYNYPKEPSNIVANLIVLEGRLIGGDICNTAIDGFIHGLMPVIDFENSSENDSADDALTPVESENDSSVGDADESKDDSKSDNESAVDDDSASDNMSAADDESVDDNTSANDNNKSS